MSEHLPLRPSSIRTAVLLLYVGLGSVPKGFDEGEFSKAVVDSTLILSRVAFINGKVVPPDLIDLSSMWNTPQNTSRYPQY